MEFTSFSELVSAYVASRDQKLFLRRLKAQNTSDGYRSLLKQLLAAIPKGF